MAERVTKDSVHAAYMQLKRRAEGLGIDVSGWALHYGSGGATRVHYFVADSKGTDRIPYGRHGAMGCTAAEALRFLNGAVAAMDMAQQHRLNAAADAIEAAQMKCVGSHTTVRDDMTPTEPYATDGVAMCPACRLVVSIERSTGSADRWVYRSHRTRTKVKG